jgi:hypothetical protein
MGVELRYPVHDFPVVEDDEMPGLTVYGRRRVHRRGKDRLKRLFVNRFTRKFADASAIEKEFLEFHFRAGL